MYSSYLGQELARARINDQLAWAEAGSPPPPDEPVPAASEPASRRSCPCPSCAR